MSEAGVFSAETSVRIMDAEDFHQITLPLLEVYHSAGGNAMIEAMDSGQQGGTFFGSGRKGGMFIPAETMTALCKWWLRNHNSERCPACSGEGWVQKD